MQRWVVLVAGVVLQTILGGIYAWSAFVPALMERYGLTNGQCGLVFGTAIAVFTLSMILAGRALQAYGPRITAGTGAILFAAGYVTASFSGGSFPLIFVGIAVLVGAGIGAGYVCPLTVAMAWFPRHRGLITGVAVAGFGGGAVFLGALADYLLHGPEWDVLSVFRFVGVGFGAVAFVAALLLSEPGGRTDGSTQSRPAPRGGLVSHLFSREFGLLCLGMFAGTFAGLLSVGNLKPLILNAGLGVRVATAGISVFACGNAVGRVFWGQVHDRLGSRTTILLSQATLGLALIPLAFRLGRHARRSHSLRLRVRRVLRGVRIVRGRPFRSGSLSTTLPDLLPLVRSRRDHGPGYRRLDRRYQRRVCTCRVPECGPRVAGVPDHAVGVPPQGGVLILARTHSRSRPWLTTNA
jgi:OFA family oxalate/formate antiporter-like MFS transporter